MEHYSAFYRRAFVAASVVVLGYALIRILDPFWGALEWAAVLTFLLHPLHIRLTRRLAGRAGLSAGILTGLTPFVIMAPLAALAVIFARQVANLIAFLRGEAITPAPAMLHRVEHYRLVHPVILWIRHSVPVTMQQIDEWIMAGVRSALQSAASISGNVMIGVAGTLVGFFLMLFLLFFLLRDGHAMLKQVTRLIPLDEARRGRLVQDLSSTLRAVVFGTAATAIIEGALIGVGFAIVGLPSPVVLGVFAVIAAFIPAVGTAVVLVPAILYLAIIGRWGAAVFLLVWSLIIVAAEQLLRPMISARHGSVSTLAVFIGAIGGVAAFGFLGIVIGPVLLSLIAALLRIAEEAVVSRRRG
ncbi:MAG TPA: AI-2E family transporter [Steroidobacteraceae bacterium]|nr:AI-2E family transporter [Steroidobacteraceae bacterium]